MSEENQHAVADDTNAQAKPDAAGNDARNDGGDELAKLLSQYDKDIDPGTKQPNSTPDKQQGAAPQIDPKEIVAQVRAEIQAENRFTADMNDTIKVVRGDLDPETFDYKFVKAYIDAQADADPRLAKAWLDRHKNPAQFEKVRGELAKGLSKKFSKLPDRQTSEDRAAVSHAVRGSSKSAPEGKAPDFSRASNNDFRNEVEKNYGYKPAV